MSNFSVITIIFTDELVSEKFISFDSSWFPIHEEWQEVRTGVGTVGVSQGTGTKGEGTAINFAQAFEVDYNSNNLFEVEQVGNTVIISARQLGVEFDSFQTNSEYVNHTIENNTEEPFLIQNVSFSAGSNCNKIAVTVQTSTQADYMSSPFYQLINSNPFTFEYDRELTFELVLHASSGRMVQRVMSTVGQVFPSGIQLEINNSPGGSIVTILAGAFGLNLTYSIDGVNFRTSNVFSGLIGGDYTAYVKDQFGCITQKPFRLDSFGINSPYFYLPTANSIRYASRVNWGDCSNYKNDDNTLSCEVDSKIAYQEIQQFQSCDKIVTQFKSNYERNSASVTTMAGGYRLLPIVKKTNNMRRSDRRDAVKVPLPSGKVGIMFLSGNVYDYDTGVITGDYTLNGSLPVWGREGNYLQISGTWYLIEQVRYEEELQAEVLVISALSSQNQENVIVGSVFNLQNYEVYEFEIDFFEWLNSRLQVRITASDDYFGEIRYLSEMIDVKVRHQNTVEIKYWDDDNTDVFFQTGIINKMRLGLEKSYGQPSGEVETYDTDTDTLLLNADIRQLDIFVFSPMTKAMMWKLDEALSHKFVEIDGVRYSDKQIEVSENLGESNLYEVTATMKKANAVYRGGELRFDETPIEIPGLIRTDNGFVKYN